ncbi:hypothetical protein HDV00_006668 [Rhizophlyctis rosea]|nr:hypothetical protein HDV00_006668 [Rhizophlyctis rosea]
MQKQLGENNMKIVKPTTIRKLRLEVEAIIGRLRRDAGDDDVAIETPYNPGTYLEFYCHQLCAYLREQEELPLEDTCQILQIYSEKLLKVVKLSGLEQGRSAKFTAAIMVVLAWEGYQHKAAHAKVSQFLARLVDRNIRTFQKTHSEVLKFIIAHANMNGLTKLEANVWTIFPHLYEVVDAPENFVIKQQEDGAPLHTVGERLEAQRDTQQPRFVGHEREINFDANETGQKQTHIEPQHSPPAAPQPSITPALLQAWSKLPQSTIPKSKLLAPKPAIAPQFGAALTTSIIIKQEDMDERISNFLSRSSTPTIAPDEPSRPRPHKRQNRLPPFDIPKGQNANHPPSFVHTPPIKSDPRPIDPHIIYGPPAYIRNRKLDQNLEQRIQFAQSRIELRLAPPDPLLDDLLAYYAATDAYDEMIEGWLVQGLTPDEIRSMSWYGLKGDTSVLERQPWRGGRTDEWSGQEELGTGTALGEREEYYPPPNPLYIAAHVADIQAFLKGASWTLPPPDVVASEFTIAHA